MELENEKLKADLEVSKSKEAPAPVVEAPKVTTSTGVAPKTDTQKLFDITEEINSIFSDKGYSVTFENVDISRNGEKGYFIK